MRPLPRLGAALLLLLLAAAKPAEVREVGLLEDAPALTRLIGELGQGGRPVVLHFWATWCQACVEEMPAFLKAARRATKDGAQVALISVDAPADRTGKVPKFLQTRGYEGPAYLLAAEDPTPVAEALGLTDWDGALPATVVLKDGKLVARHYGKLPGAKTLERDVAKAMGAAK